MQDWEALAAVALALIAINIAVFAVFAFDKRRARQAGWRVPERRLLWLAAWGGGIGAKAAQRLLRHKTRKQPFARRLNLILGGQTVLVMACALALIWSPQVRQTTMAVLDVVHEAGRETVDAVRQAPDAPPAPERASGATVKINRGL